MTNTITMCEIVNNLDRMSEKDIENGLRKSAPYVQRYAYILHDKDVYTEDCFDKKTGELLHKEGEPIAPHWHIALDFAFDEKNDKIRKTFKTIADDFGVNANCVSKVRSGKYIKNLLYLTHRNASEKYPYDFSEVTANFNYSDLVTKELEKQQKGMTEKAILKRIESGEITRYNYTEKIPFSDCVKFKKTLETAFTVMDDIKSSNSDRNATCIYITGKPGCGKTTYAKKLAREKGLSYFISGGSNDIMDGYKGEKCLILDDLRPSAMCLSDLLKLLDNNTNSRVKSRYHNKVNEAEMIIITTTLNIENFFKSLSMEERESKVQFFRRCEFLLEITEKEIKTYTFNPETGGYDFCCAELNTICGKFKNKAQDIKDKYSRIFGKDPKAMLSPALPPDVLADLENFDPTSFEEIGTDPEYEQVSIQMY